MLIMQIGVCVRERGRFLISCLVLVWPQENMLWDWLPQSAVSEVKIGLIYTGSLATWKQGRVQPNKARGAISVMFGSQVS